MHICNLGHLLLYIHGYKQAKKILIMDILCMNLHLNNVEYITLS